MDPGRESCLFLSSLSPSFPCTPPSQERMPPGGPVSPSTSCVTCVVNCEMGHLEPPRVPSALFCGSGHPAFWPAGLITVAGLRIANTVFAGGRAGTVILHLWLALPGPHMSAPSSAHCLSEMWEARESMMSSSNCWLSERSVGSLETCGGGPEQDGTGIPVRAEWAPKMGRVVARE